MATRKSWFSRLKKFFGIETKTKEEKKETRKGWLFKRLKSKYSPALMAPLPRKEKTLREAEEVQSKHALAVAVATAAAAEAAVAAAQAAAHVVRLTGVPLSHKRSQEAAAIKIQTVFRGYLARRALRALKGLVRLQALVRGQAVRRQTNITLRSLQSLIKIQSQTRASRMRSVEDCRACENKGDVHWKNKEVDIKKTANPKGERRWDGSILSKEDVDAILKSRLEAALKRERAMEYACSNQGRRISRRPNTPVAEELESEILNHRWSWLEQWVGSQPCEKDIPEVYPVSAPDRNSHDHQIHASKCSHKEKAEVNQLRPLARRSFNWSRRTLLRDDESYTSSPSLPSYMASTASTKARFRSMSTPRQRMGMTDTFSEHCIPYTNGLLSPITSIASDAGLSRSVKFPLSHHKSPLIKGQSPPVKSRRSSNYLSFDSECSLPNWDRGNAFS